MKRTLLFALLMIFLGLPAMLVSQDVITGYTFPTGDTATDIYPNLGLGSNSNYYISAEDTTAHPNTVQRPISFTDGASDFAATASGWDGGEFAKLWSIKFKADGYENLKVSSKQYSDGTFPGPRDFKIQARKSGSDFVDLSGGNISVSNDWITGVATDVALPPEFNDPGSTSLYIRWIMTSNMDINGNTVMETGISKIDDVIVTGTSLSGIEETLYDSRFSFSPNPVTQGMVTISSKDGLEEIRIFDIQGKEVMIAKDDLTRIDVSTLKPGVYFIMPVFSENLNTAPQRMIIQ
ncbi:MAG: T9SS type A sorting domain-containing protein [Bacteroidetes bacterium]|nr:T9SS type A sorting domain-containing protein [Bacteroidota bacterium]